MAWVGQTGRRSKNRARQSAGMLTSVTDVSGLAANGPVAAASRRPKLIEQAPAIASLQPKNRAGLLPVGEAVRHVPARTMAWGGDHPRDAILKDIEVLGVEGWNEARGYQRRSIAEKMMYRLKQLLGERMFSREFDRQVTEGHVRAAIINRMTYLIMPKSVRLGQLAPPE